MRKVRLKRRGWAIREGSVQKTPEPIPPIAPPILRPSAERLQARSRAPSRCFCARAGEPILLAVRSPARSLVVDAASRRIMGRMRPNAPRMRLASAAVADLPAVPDRIETLDATVNPRAARHCRRGRPASTKSAASLLCPRAPRSQSCWGHSAKDDPPTPFQGVPPDRSLETAAATRDSLVFLSLLSLDRRQSHPRERRCL
jgi:hypothetical protein